MIYHEVQCEYHLHMNGIDVSFFHCISERTRDIKTKMIWNKKRCNLQKPHGFPPYMEECFDTDSYPFHMVNTRTNHFGLHTCRDMKLVTLKYGIDMQESVTIVTGFPVAKTELLRNYNDCFKGVGCFQDEYKLVTPRSHQ